MKKWIAMILLMALCALMLSACGGDGPAVDSPLPSVEQSQEPVDSVATPDPTPKLDPEGVVDVTWETGAVTVEYYEGSEITQTEQEGGALLIQVPQGAYLEKLAIFAPEGKVEVVGVLAAQYDIETVGHDIDIYLPEGTAFHVMLLTIRDIFESDFPYDVTMTKHEYIYLTDGVEINLETVIGIARVLVLK